MALERTDRPILMELDCKEAVSMITTPGIDRSSNMACIQEIKAMLENDREVVVKLISRSQNRVSDALAAYGRTMPRTAVWLGSSLGEIATLCMNDIMPP